MDRFFKTCLVLIVLLLAVIALRLIMSPHSVHAQGQHKFVAVKTYGATNASPGYRIQDVLDKYAADGWELAAPIYVGGDTGGPLGELYLIFRK
jgi:hypothetical protein